MISTGRVYMVWSALSAGQRSSEYGCNPAHIQLSRGNVFFFLFPRSRLKIWSRETGSAVPSRVSPLILRIRLNLVLTHGIILVDGKMFRDESESQFSILESFVCLSAGGM